MIELSILKKIGMRAQLTELTEEPQNSASFVSSVSCARIPIFFKLGDSIMLDLYFMPIK